MIPVSCPTPEADAGPKTSWLSYKMLPGAEAAAEHLPAIESLAQKIEEQGKVKSSKSTGQIVCEALEQHREVFTSHIDTHNCSSGECVKLAPAPCQMTCPAGLDIPTYVTLIGMGRDAEAIDVIRRDCPFPWVCGLVCTRPCEFMCVRARIDTPISIKSSRGLPPKGLCRKAAMQIHQRNRIKTKGMRHRGRTRGNECRLLPGIKGL